MLRRAFMAFVMLSLLLAFPAAAQNITANDRAQISQQATKLHRLFIAGKYRQMYGMMSPRFAAHLKREHGLPLFAITRFLGSDMKSRMRGVTVHSHAIAVDHAQFSQTSAGRAYALLPAVLDAENAEGRAKFMSHLLAFKDDGKWYIMRVDRARARETLTAVYPDFAGINFPAPQEIQ